MDIKQVGDIHEISFISDGDNWEQYVLLVSDEHFDSKKCDRILLKAHHELAKKRNAPILKFGDTFDVMGCKQDPRSDLSMIRPEYMKSNYLDKVVNDAAKFFKGYPIAFMGMGNHEQNIEKRHETNVIERLADKLGCLYGGYSGYIRFKFRDIHGGKVRSLVAYYNHGTGGNSPVTKGVIQTNRRGVAFDADMFISGHNHNRWYVELIRQWVDTVGKIRRRVQHHINLGTYKDADAWEQQMGFPSPNKGGVWIRFYKRKVQGTMDICAEIVNA